MASADLDASAPDGYITYGGGVMLNLSNKVLDIFLYQKLQIETDYSETTISGSLKLKF